MIIMSKRKLILLIILSIWLSFFSTDLILSFFNKKPIFSIPLFHYDDGGSCTYVGLLYNYNKMRVIMELEKYEIERDNGDKYDFIYFDHYSDFSIVTPWLFMASSISRDTIESHYLEIDIRMYKSIKFKDKMLEGYTLIDEYTTTNSKRYVKIIQGYETNDCIIIYYDNDGNIINYYKSHYLYSTSYNSGSDYSKYYSRNVLKYDNTIIYNDKEYVFKEIVSKKRFFIGDPSDGNIIPLKLYVLQYENEFGKTIKIKKYYNTFNTYSDSEIDINSFNVDLEI